MIVWNIDKNTVYRATKKDLFEAIYMVTSIIPIGRVTSYKEIAETLGIHPRIVGLALKNNDKPLIIPCHRVVGVDGDLKNYSYGGRRVKKKLLEIEGIVFKDDRVPRKYFIKIDELFK